MESGLDITESSESPQPPGGRVALPGGRGGLIHPFPPGQSGNPGGRPKVNRTVSAAFAELQDTPGATPDECIEAFKAARGAKLCGADHKAIALFRTENASEGRTQVSAIETTLDRLEGKVEQPHAVRAQETEALIRQLAESTGIDPEAIRALGMKLGGQG